MSAASSKPKSNATIAAWLKASTDRLQAANIPTARLDALVLLCDALHVDKAWVFAHSDAPLDPVHAAQLQSNVTRRAGHVPLAYIRNVVAFYGRDFYVDASVLVPRPESETMIDALLGLPLSNNVSICDVGTGSGALGITAALELNSRCTTVSQVQLVDIDPDCLQIAARNATYFAIPADCIRSDLLRGAEPSNVVLANLPYVPDSHTINSAALQEPSRAIFGGADGLDLYRTMFGQLRTGHGDWKPQFVLTEALPFQHDALADIARIHGYQLLCSDDFIQVFTPRLP